jgi:aspartyl-tRNA(Asn)/glutamyl-tRNA(Gln) amidotransferase subunit B
VGADKARAKKVANWLLGEMSRLLNATGKEVQDCPVRPSQLVELLDLVDRGTLSGPAAKAVFEEMFHTGRDPGPILQEKGLAQISEEDSLAGTVREVLAANPQAVADYKKGKAQAITFLLGQVMRQSRGANPTVVRQLLEKELATGV